MFRFNKTIIREPTVCASLKLQYWCQLKYFVIEISVVWPLNIRSCWYVYRAQRRVRLQCLTLQSHYALCTIHVHIGRTERDMIKKVYWSSCRVTVIPPSPSLIIFHSFTVHLDIIKSFIRSTNAKLNCFLILKFTLKFT